MTFWSYTVYSLVYQSLVWFSTRFWGLRTVPGSSKDLINNCWMNEWNDDSRKEQHPQKQKWRCEQCCQVDTIYIHQVSKVLSGLIPTEQRVRLWPRLWHKHVALALMLQVPSQPSGRCHEHGEGGATLPGTRWQIIVCWHLSRVLWCFVQKKCDLSKRRTSKSNAQGPRLQAALRTAGGPGPGLTIPTLYFYNLFYWVFLWLFSLGVCLRKITQDRKFISTILSVLPDF